MARLTALVPAPRRHRLRYHGTLAPNAARRKLIVPKAPEEAPRGGGGPGFADIETVMGGAAAPGVCGRCLDMCSLRWAHDDHREPERPGEFRRFSLGPCLGEGGYGTVFRATDDVAESA